MNIPLAPAMYSVFASCLAIALAGPPSVLYWNMSEAVALEGLS